jgi:hypothetical protein
MLIALALTFVAGGAFGFASLKYGAEDRPGFNERAPLA